MFTGLVEDIGRIESAVRRGDSVALTIAPRSMNVEELALGESVAIDGTCLTVFRSFILRVFWREKLRVAVTVLGWHASQGKERRLGILVYHFRMGQSPAKDDCVI